MTQTKNEKLIWGIFLNVPGAEARTLYEQATRILVNRNIIPKPRERKSKGEASGDKTNHPAS
jgi:hypothetical protein